MSPPNPPRVLFLEDSFTQVDVTPTNLATVWASPFGFQVGEVSGVLDTARRILRGMSRREIQNKVAVILFAIVMIGVIAIMIWYGRNRP